MFVAASKHVETLSKSLRRPFDWPPYPIQGHQRPSLQEGHCDLAGVHMSSIGFCYPKQRERLFLGFWTNQASPQALAPAQLIMNRRVAHVKQPPKTAPAVQANLSGQGGTPPTRCGNLSTPSSILSRQTDPPASLSFTCCSSTCEWEMLNPPFWLLVVGEPKPFWGTYKHEKGVPADLLLAWNTSYHDATD